MRRFFVPTLVLLSLILNKAHSHSFVCDTLMSSPNEINAYEESDLDETDHFIVYLESLLEEGIIKEVHLSRFILGLERGRVLNPLENQEGSAAEIQKKGIQEFIDRDGLDRDRLLVWAEEKIEEKNRNQVNRDHTRKETRGLHFKMEFHPVRVGRFQMGQRRAWVDLTHPIEVLSTQVTQGQWVQVMGMNPSYFKEGKHSIVVPGLNGQSIMLQPDHPVESVTWWSVLVFANRLSEKHGLMPAYDFSGVTWETGTTAENGTLRGEGEVKIQTSGGVHDPYNGDIYYQAEGYRLPTEAEQEFLLRAGGRANGKYYFGNDVTRLKDHAWHSDNSGKETHPVAELKPLILDGNKFYDLLGNVSEWSWNGSGSGALGGRNPVGPEGKKLRTFRGASWDDLSNGMLSSTSFSSPPNDRGAYIGFRLVRTIKRSKKKGTR